MQTKEQFKEILGILKTLYRKYPNQGIARHIHEATIEYKNLWTLPNDELLFTLTKYQLELEENIIDETEIDWIIEDGKNLDINNLFEDNGS